MLLISGEPGKEGAGGCARRLPALPVAGSGGMRGNGMHGGGSGSAMVATVTATTARLDTVRRAVSCHRPQQAARLLSRR